MARLHRVSLALLLSLLLVGLQLGASVHAIGHFGDALKHTPDHSYGVPQDEPCPICTLFAGGTHAVAGDNDVATHAASSDGKVLLEPASIATPAPSYYSSRAPPTLH